MSYIRGATTTMAALVVPLIFLYKLWYVRRSSNGSKHENGDNRQMDSASVVDSLCVLSNSTDPSSSLPSLESIDSTSVVDDSFVTPDSIVTPSSFPSIEYEVFLSFRGQDTRHQITDILYHFLQRMKIHTFKDDDELRKGEEIGSDILQAIDQSNIYVPIISKSYAHSKWCLAELAEIIRRQEQDTQRIILPIFYMVDQRDVRYQTGPFQNAFEEHVKKFDERTVQNWKDALNTVGALKGWHVTNNDEQGAVADEVAADLWSRLQENLTLRSDELVGIDDHVEAVVEKLSLDSNCVTMVGLYGMGGIGKTTIAKAVYDNVSSRFDRCYFIENIREMQAQKNGMVVLQNKQVSDILRVDSFRFKILIVLDDVDETFKFQDILGSPDDFVSGSRFIITSRNKKVLSTLTENGCKLYEVGPMSQSHSLELFSKHAFRKNSPPPDYETIANDIVLTTKGHPLTLKVIGSLLFREDFAVWKEKLEQLRETERVSLYQILDQFKMEYEEQ
ncbi:Disease resistance protein L6 [Linum perenne]